MDAWWRSLAGDYFNPRWVDAIWSHFDGTSWRLRISIGDEEFDLSGSWTTQAAAQDSARQLVHGFDPASLG